MCGKCTFLCVYNRNVYSYYERLKIAMLFVSWQVWNKMIALYRNQLYLILNSEERLGLHINFNIFVCKPNINVEDI